MFFLPTVTDDYAPVDVPSCEGMELRANSLQNFGKWGRRVSRSEWCMKGSHCGVIAHYDGESDIGGICGADVWVAW